MAHRTKRSMVDTGFRGSDVETSERTCGCRSGIKWPQWHSLVFEGQVRVDMRHVCPKRREEDALETGQVSLVEEVGSEALRRRYMARASSGSAAKANTGRVD